MKFYMSMCHGITCLKIKKILRKLSCFCAKCVFLQNDAKTQSSKNNGGGGQGGQTWGFPPDLGFSDVVWGYGVIRLNLGFSPKNIENLNQILQRIFRNIDSWGFLERCH